MARPANFSTKDRILGAAEELFAQHGFAATSLRQVTGLAAVNIAAVNYH
nr:TetR family transcriptional regulator [Pseudoxanthomonas sp.]